MKMMVLTIIIHESNKILTKCLSCKIPAILIEMLVLLSNYKSINSKLLLVHMTVLS